MGLAIKQLMPPTIPGTFLVGVVFGCLVSSFWRESASLDASIGGWIGVFGSQGGLLTSRLRLGEWGPAGNENLTGMYMQAEDIAKLRKTAVEVAELRLELLKGLRDGADVITDSHTAPAGDGPLANETGVQQTATLLRGSAPVATEGKQETAGGLTGGAGSLAGSGCDTGRFQYLAAGVVVEGPTVCLAGALCSFSIQSNNASHWETSIKLAQELIVYFVGPARAVADLSVDHYSGAKAAWTATFRLWDAGEYRALIQTGCSSLGLIETLADLTLVIVPNPNSGALTPCNYGQGYRWLRDAAGGYEWTNYACAPPLVPAADYAFLMRRKGFKRLIFVGDSQQRALYQHLKFLLGAPVREVEISRPKHDLSEVIHEGDPERELHLLFYWIDGIYENGEFGCINRGMFSGRNASASFPNVTTGADVIALEAGTWTAAWCADAWAAFNKHLPEYLDWGEKLVTPAGRLVWRTASSFMTECRRKHVKLQYVNRVALDAVAARPYQPFSSWDVEAPRFADLQQFHYSWTTFDAATNRVVMAGPVGEAVARAYMTWTIHTLQ